MLKGRVSTRDAWDKAAARVPTPQDRQLRDRAARERELATVATPQTIRKRQVDIIEVWYERGKLGDAQRQAAQEILRVWEAIARGLGARTQAWDRGSRGSSLVEDWPASLRRAYAGRYAPWSTEAARMMVTGTASAKDLVLAAVVNNEGPTHLERHFRMGADRARRAIQASLYRYADLAGWISGEPTGETAEAVATLNRLREEMTQAPGSRAERNGNAGISACEMVHRVPGANQEQIAK